MRRAGLILAFLLLAVGGAAAQPAVLVLDGSSSMWGRLDGRTKTDILRDQQLTVADFINSRNSFCHFILSMKVWYLSSASMPIVNAFSESLASALSMRSLSRFSAREVNMR